MLLRMNSTDATPGVRNRPYLLRPLAVLSAAGPMANGPDKDRLQTVTDGRTVTARDTTTEVRLELTVLELGTTAAADLHTIIELHHRLRLSMIASRIGATARLEVFLHLLERAVILCPNPRDILLEATVEVTVEVIVEVTADIELRLATSISQATKVDHETNDDPETRMTAGKAVVVLRTQAILVIASEMTGMTAADIETQIARGTGTQETLAANAGTVGRDLGAQTDERSGAIGIGRGTETGTTGTGTSTPDVSQGQRDDDFPRYK